MAGTQDIVKIGLLGGAAYLAYKWYEGQGAAASTTAPLTQSSGTAPSTTASPTSSVTTPTVTSPSAPATVSPASLSAAAVAQGAGSMLNPDQWNWLVVNVLKAPALVLDAFGPVSQASRTATYSAGDFYAIATGSMQAPTPTTAPPAAAPAATVQPGTAAYLQQLAGGASQLNPDQWNYYLGGTYSLDAAFGPAGSAGRTNAITAQQFLDAVASGGMSGLGLIQSSRAPYLNPILRPNIPGTRRWIPVPQRHGMGRVFDTKRGWAV